MLSLDQSLSNKNLFYVVKIQKTKIRKHISFNEGRWSKQEHLLFIQEMFKYGINNWKKVKFLNYIFHS